MKIDPSEIKVKCGEMVRENLEKEGWTVLYENKDLTNPVDMKALKTPYTVLVNISYRMEDGDFPDNKGDKEKQLKTLSKDEKAWPYKAEIILNKDLTLKKMKFEMLE